MAASVLLASADRDITGAEVSLRIIGSREPPTNMVIQIAITGTADVHIQGRIARDAPWQLLGETHSMSAIIHVKAVQFLRAVTLNVADGAKVSVWADWGW
jgi:hypothetical protein